MEVVLRILISTRAEAKETEKDDTIGLSASMRIAYSSFLGEGDILIIKKLV